MLSQSRPATAQTEPAPPGTVEPGSEPSELEAAVMNRGKVSISAGMDFTTAYFFRGILQERNGFIWQPYAGINFKLFEGGDDSFVDSLIFSVATWNSVHSNKTLASGSGPTNWYESDVIVGGTLGFADYFSANLELHRVRFPERLLSDGSGAGREPRVQRRRFLRST